MVDIDNVLFNIAAFLGGLFVLHYGADKFVSHTATVASRLHIPATVVTMLTAGAQWEELVVVIIAVTQDRTPLAIGNVLGSSISNTLGAFSLGLIFSPTPVVFDTSSKIYTVALLALTTFFASIVVFLDALGRFGGAVLLCMFVVYIVSIVWAIYNGLVTAPAELSSGTELDSDTDSDSETDVEEGRRHLHSGVENGSLNDRRSSTSSTTLQNAPASPPSELPITSSSSEIYRPSPAAKPLLSADPDRGSDTDSDVDLDLTTPSSSNHLLQALSPQGKPLIKPHSSSSSNRHHHSHHSHRRTLSASSHLKPHSRPKSHSTIYHTLHLLIGLLSLSLSGYILSHTLTSLATATHLSSTILGTTILSFATTLPEKFVAVVAGRRGQSGVLVANTAGGNIFLVTLCAGVLLCAGNLKALKECVTPLELGVMWTCSALMVSIVNFGGRRWMGVGLLAGYVAFIVLEFTVNRR